MLQFSAMARHKNDPIEESARALEARASRRDEAAEELGRTAAELVVEGSSIGVEPILRASRGHRIRALEDRAVAAALRLATETGSRVNAEEAADYHSKAEDCLRAASRISDPKIKATWLRMAQRWLHLAQSGGLVAPSDRPQDDDENDGRLGG